MQKQRFFYRNFSDGTYKHKKTGVGVMACKGENMKDLEVIYKKIDELIPYENNQRNNDGAVETVAKSIKEFGFKVPIVIDKEGVIAAGHTRLKAAKELGLEEVPCIIADDLTPEQVKAFRLADNKVGELAFWDFELLNLELEELKNINFDMEQFGFEIDLQEETGVIEDDFDCELEEETDIKQGDIFQLGRHRLMCGDSTSKDDISKLLKDKEIDMIFTDPPYGMGLNTDYSSMESKLEGMERGSVYESGLVDEFDPQMIERIIGLNAKEVFLWGADYFSDYIPKRNDGSWIVWDKRTDEDSTTEQSNSSDKMFGSCFELCWSKVKHKRNIVRVKWAGIFGLQTQDIKKRIHPTQKPIELCTWFIGRYSDSDNNILDLFGGSGSTLIACEQTERNCLMMDLDPKYCDVIIKRWEEFTGQKAIKINE